MQVTPKKMDEIRDGAISDLREGGIPVPGDVSPQKAIDLWLILWRTDEDFREKILTEGPKGAFKKEG